jgi:hypothetical protein
VRISVVYEGLAERIGAALNRVPVPLGYAMFGMPVARSLQLAQRTGLLTALAAGPATAEALAEGSGLRPQPTKLLLDSLCAAGQLKLVRGERYQLPARSRKWLDPASGNYVGGFLEDTWHYWDWWAQLDGLVRDGRSVELHDRAPGDPYWRSYITGQYELARLSSDAVAKAVALRRGAESVLDVAGAHGEFSMALCRRHPGLRATVIELPGSARIGREIVAQAGMSDRVRHREGDMFEADLGGPHDGALVFNIVHHLSPDQAVTLFQRIAAALAPGAPLCVLDLYSRPPGRKPDSGALLGLFFHLTSGAATYSTGEVAEWLARSGFGRARLRRLPQLPGLALVRAERS